jgi:hypothetical protein
MSYVSSCVVSRSWRPSTCRSCKACSTRRACR